MHVATAGGSAAALCAPPRVSAPTMPFASAGGTIAALCAPQMSSNYRKLGCERLSYARGRLRELRKVCPDLTEEVLQRCTLPQVAWASRRAGKRG
eukprot:9228174-Karenia_brevis.AAC.1